MKTYPLTNKILQHRLTQRIAAFHRVWTSKHVNQREGIIEALDIKLPEVHVVSADDMHELLGLRSPIKLYVGRYGWREIFGRQRVLQYFR